MARLNLLRPHLARSALVSARMQHKRAQGAAEALIAMHLPAFLRAGGEVVEMSPLGTDVSSLVILGAHGRLRLADRQADALLDDALASLTSAPAISARSFPVRDAAGTPRQVAHLIPVQRGAHDVFGDSMPC